MNAELLFEMNMLGAVLSLSVALPAKPITGPWPKAFPAKELCSNCGLCKSSVGVASVTEACAFLGDGMSRAERLEEQVHGRARRYDAEADDLDECHFGVHDEIVLARGFLNNAQWTGVATGVALAWLESGAVDAVVVAGADDSASGFGAPQPILCRSVAEVLRGRRVKPSLCPSLEVLDEVSADASIQKLLFCGVGCAVQALRSMNSASPEAALGLEPGGLYVLGTHCVDNSPTPEASQAFVSCLPGVGEKRAKDVLACDQRMLPNSPASWPHPHPCPHPRPRPHPCPRPRPHLRPRLSPITHHRHPHPLPNSSTRGTDEFMADFRVHTRLREPPDADADAVDGTDEPPLAESVAKDAYMTLPPSIGIPSIAPSCFACFDYTNGLADLVVGYMGAPFDASTDEMVTAPLMVTVRNPRGQQMLETAVASGRVEILQRGGHGGRDLPSSGSRRAITIKTVEADSMVKTIIDPSFAPADRGAPPVIGNLLASIIAKSLPRGMEFGRYSIDYHYLRNQLYVHDTMGETRAARHVPRYATALMSRCRASAIGPCTLHPAPRALGSRALHLGP